MDWADEIAERVNRERVATVGDRETLIATALRKAKADGMREAIGTVFEAWRTNTDKDFIAIMARLHANAIEKGTG